VRLFGWDLTLTKAALPVSGSRGWFPLVREPYGGAWQKNDPIRMETVLAHHAVYTCVTLIASDIGKLRPRLVVKDRNGIWTETESPAFSPVLRKPNRYQNHIQFRESWIISKLLHGNAYVLKERDARQVVQRLHVLDPSRVRVLVGEDGSVFYQLDSDSLAGLADDAVVVPASEVIHDRSNCLFHPLVGISPIYASGIAANMGLQIEQNASAFFRNGSNPSGIVTTPLEITKAKADELSERWNSQFGGANSGRVPILGSDLKFQGLRMSAVDSQMIEHLKWTAETVCATFHVPAWKVGVGQMPTYQNGEILNGIYYTDCLQSHIEQWELCVDEGLGLSEKVEGRQLGVELDLDDLLRMDTATQIKAWGEGTIRGLVAPNEGRRKLNLPPVEGGEAPYLQQQNYSLAALAARDAAGPPGDAPPPPNARAAEGAAMGQLRLEAREAEAILARRLTRYMEPAA
jgi:HK97 family phage portal protein